MLVRIYKEVRDYFVDILRVIQYWLIIFTFSNDMVGFILFIYTNDVDSLAIEIVFDIIGTLFLYYIINQLSSYMLIAHLDEYIKMRYDTSYEQWRKRLRKLEIKALIFAIIFQVLFILTIVGVDLIFEYNKIDIHLKNSILYGIYALISLTLATCEILLFIKGSKSMKKNLNYYYEKYKKGMACLAITNITWFLTLASLFLLVSIGQIPFSYFTFYIIFIIMLYFSLKYKMFE